jgi:RNA polymerase sigma factor (sigma-70 family)
LTTNDLIPHLFRTEYRKIVSVLCKRFGFDHVEIAEDIASETFLTATQTWGIEGTPANPSAWLYLVAKNKAKNYWQRQQVFENKIVPELRQHSLHADYSLDLSPQNINDSQLQMMFAVCHPSVPQEAQIGLALRLLCGFGIEEIANAFLTNKETVSKRLLRAKEKIREEKIAIEFPDAGHLDDRLSSVLATIYLLFNEGYYSSIENRIVRKELCLEALRLCTMLVENESTNKPQVNALLSLMCFHLSRFDARMNDDGDLVLYHEQDTSLWNSDLISKGGYFLSRSAQGNSISKYHLEAAIAYWNTQQADTPEKWENILQLYNQLLQIQYSPIAAMNRTYALSKARGKDVAIVEAEKLELRDNHLYLILLADLYSGIDNQKASYYFNQALPLIRNEHERKVIIRKLQALPV